LNRAGIYAALTGLIALVAALYMTTWPSCFLVKTENRMTSFQRFRYDLKIMGYFEFRASANSSGTVVDSFADGAR
jgi:hypothetical protein